MKRKTLSALLAGLLIAAMPFAAAASTGGGGGTGGGSGGGDAKLALVSSSVKDGQKDVAADTVLTLTFSNNVVNLTVKENNAGCFSMTDEAGADVSVTVEMADDQLEQDKRNDIVVRADGGMKPGATYTLTVSGDLEAKNGNKLGDDATLTFTVAEAADTEEAAAEESSAVSQETRDDGAEDNPNTGVGGSMSVALLTLLGAGGVMAATVRGKRNRD